MARPPSSATERPSKPVEDRKGVRRLRPRRKKDVAPPIVATADGGATWTARVLEDPADRGLDHERAVVDPVDGTIWTVWTHVVGKAKHHFVRAVRYNPNSNAAPFTFGSAFELVSPTDASGNRIGQGQVALAVSRDISGGTRLHAVWADRSGDPGSCYPGTKPTSYFYSTTALGVVSLGFSSAPPLSGQQSGVPSLLGPIWSHHLIATDNKTVRCASPSAANPAQNAGNTAYQVNPRVFYSLSPYTGRHLLVVSHGTTNGNNRIRVYRSTDPLNAWHHTDLGPPTSSQVNLWRPSLAIYPFNGGNSRVGVKWLETRTDGSKDGLTRVMMATSTDDGVTFGASQELSVVTPSSGGTIDFRYKDGAGHPANTKDYDDMAAIEPSVNGSFTHGGFFAVWPDQRYFETRLPYQELWAASVRMDS